jgi:hypothetical protein
VPWQISIYLGVRYQDTRDVDDSEDEDVEDIEFSQFEELDEDGEEECRNVYQVLKGHFLSLCNMIDILPKDRKQEAIKNLKNHLNQERASLKALSGRDNGTIVSTNVRYKRRKRMLSKK